jgi:hypothetical protein
MADIAVAKIARTAASAMLSVAPCCPLSAASRRPGRSRRPEFATPIRQSRLSTALALSTMWDDVPATEFGGAGVGAPLSDKGY